jgi:energy-coupling factor transport system permease protein
MQYHSLSWVVWLVAVLITLSATRNPLYLFLLLLVILVINGWLRLHPASREIISIPIMFILTIIAGSTLFNALTSHFGATVLFMIPGSIPLLSGSVTLEAIVYGATNGLILASMLVAFTVVNQALSVRALIGLIPQAFHSIAVIVAIGITFLPITIRQFQQIREAQTIRGLRLHKLRDWLPLVIPLLTSGLEHAMHLAEAMTARGFASQAGAQVKTSERRVLVLGLGIMVTGWVVRLSPLHPGLGWGLLALAATCIVGTLVAAGRKSRRTTYKAQPWRLADLLIIFGALITLIVFIFPPSQAARETIQYNPYPVVSLLGFDPLVAVSVFGLLVPMLTSPLRKK